MALKVVHLNMKPVDPETSRRILGQIGAQVVVAECETEEQVIQVCRDADAIMRVGGSLSRKVIESLERCRIISCYAVDIDGLDVAAATEKGIVVTFAPDSSTEEVSDHAMAFMLALGRKLFFYDRVVRAHQWGEDHTAIVRMGRPMPRLRGLTVGSIGLGRAGLALARKVQAFGMRFLAYDPYIKPDAGRELGVETADLDRVLRESDFLHLNIPLNKETHHFVDAPKLRKMKATAYLINSTARGQIIDEEALYKALKEKWIAGAALDNLEKRPLEQNPLLKLDNVILTPHVCHISDTSYEDLARRVSEDVVRFFKGEWPPVVVNPKVKEKVRLQPVSA
ncbi:MAG: C-terminal binding protein [Chloroflexi bacterium]|nr:C-terminal binding protein [Chloroflexota bacterium]